MNTRANRNRAAPVPAPDAEAPAVEAPRMHDNPAAEPDGDLSHRFDDAVGDLPSASQAGEVQAGTPHARPERSLLAPVETEVIKIVHCFLSEMESTTDRSSLPPRFGVCKFDGRSAWRGS